MPVQMLLLVRRKTMTYSRGMPLTEGQGMSALPVLGRGHLPVHWQHGRRLHLCTHAGELVSHRLEISHPGCHQPHIPLPPEIRLEHGLQTIRCLAAAPDARSRICAVNVH